MRLLGVITAVGLVLMLGQATVVDGLYVDPGHGGPGADQGLSI